MRGFRFVRLILILRNTFWNLYFDFGEKTSNLLRFFSFKFGMFETCLFFLNDNEGWYRDDTSVGFSLITFPNQIAAFNYANKLNVRCVFDESSVHVFSRECSKHGHRFFLV